MDDATTQSKCAEACLSDCSCTAYTYENSRCSIWHGEFLSVNENDGTDNISEAVLYLRLAARDFPRLRKNNRKPLVGVVTAEKIQVLWWAITWQSRKAGRGWFWFCVQRSDLTAIAVKRLDGSSQGEKQFRAESCRECIIHCDIKPENILLDESCAPKIADFGMAAIVGRDFSRVLTTLRGTIGYLAPEWISGVAVTPKIDVYSFGMLSVSFMREMREVWWIHSYMVTSIWKRLKGFEEFHVGASKRMILIGQRWVKWSEFLRAYRGLICPPCQDYLQL
uniref:Protein kinase domain-containing protein n=1 Tax=Oryza punctata TaxID=4537 RepID=A0A0E0LYC7_ORYPU